MENEERKRKLEELEDEDERVETGERVQKGRRLSTDAETSAWQAALSPAVHGSRLSTDAETSAWQVAVPPAVHEHQPYKLGQNLTSRYVIKRKIGEGYLECWDWKDCESVVIKFEASESEIEILEKLAQIPRIVQIRHCFLHEAHYFIVFEKLGPSLLEFWKQNNLSPIPVELVRVFGRQLLEAIANVHAKKIIHTNLELDNIALVSPVYTEHPDQSREMSHFRYWPDSSAIKLIDFGHSMTDKRRKRRKDRHCLTIVTSRRYRAPEVVLGLDWTYPIDIWNVGCILAEFCTGKPLFDMDFDKTMDMDLQMDLQHLATMQIVLGDLPENMTQRASQLSRKWASDWKKWAFNGHSTLEEFVSPYVQSSDLTQLIDLLNGLLKYEPSERLTAKDALEHQFFDS